MSQGTSAGVHTFCERQKPIPDGAGQYYVAGTFMVSDLFNMYISVQLYNKDVRNCAGNTKATLKDVVELHHCLFECSRAPASETPRLQ